MSCQVEDEDGSWFEDLTVLHLSALEGGESPARGVLLLEATHRTEERLTHQGWHRPGHVDPAVMSCIIGTRCTRGVMYCATLVKEGWHRQGLGWGSKKPPRSLGLY